MATKEITYKGYLYLLNRIGYWLVANDKKITHPSDITIKGVTRQYKDIIETIKKHGKDYDHNKIAYKRS